ncbi:unnamed protein product [Dibothriocephalus latus]|uniref:EF-hand domain-containing protein n=1 Tax=Dibothriocephalus latus TaxID=60516 RepID=A0A3P6TSU2_DIBLA|nr:unnamed protein product [Dibothriocephalus latus]
MAVQGFLHAFDKIDKDHDHIISHEDLRTYAKENNMPESFVTKWISLFDDKKTGSFTYEHFCDVIGLNKKPPASPAPIPQVKKEVTYLGGPMKDPMKSRVMEIFKNEWKEEDASGSVHQTLMQLDREYGLGWRSRTFDDEHNIPKVDNVKDNWIAFSPDGGNHKYIIWQQKLKKSGGCCACFV